MEIDVLGRSSQALTGEIGLSEIQNVFVEVFICPETIRLHLKSLRETHYEATVTRFEFAPRILLISSENFGFHFSYPFPPLPPLPRRERKAQALHQYFPLPTFAPPSPSLIPGIA